ncbi:MAG: ABC transporter substrate-binding protein [Rhodoferax sp.]|nr:ABC transporter substrate-binding protein [Rhodoferax sp.]
MISPLGDPLWRSRRSALAALLVALAGTLPACAKRPALRIAGHPWPGYEPIFFAESQKQLTESVVLQHFPTIKDSIDAFREGRVDAAMLTLDEALALQAQGMSLQVILVMDVSKGADALVASKGFETLTQLRGKRVGLEPSTLGELMMSMVLDRAGLKRAEIKPVFLAFEEQEAAYGAGKIDALITYEPVVGRLVAKGANKLLSTQDLPESIFDVLVVKTDVAKDYAQALEQTLQGHFWALEQLRRNPWDTAYRMVPHAGVSAEELIESFRGLELPDLIANRRYLSRDSGLLAGVVEKLSAIMLVSGNIKKPVNAANLFTDAYLPRVHG